MCYNDNTGGRPAVSTGLTFQTSTNTLKATNFDGLATKATNDADGNEISSTYIKKSIGTAKGDIIYWSSADTPTRLAAGSNGYILKMANGVPTWSSDTDNNTTYTIETGDANGQIKVKPSSGDAYNVSVKGLGSNAYTSTGYLPLTGGTLSGNLTVGTTSQSAAPTGAIHVHDIRNYTIPTTMFSSGVNWFFTAKETPTAKYWSGMHINGWNGDYYNAWELVGPSHNEDQRTTPLYVRTGRTTDGWGSWRKIYDSSNVPTKSEIGLGNVDNIALSTWAGSDKITTVGTISSGTWNGTVIGASYGGTGKSNLKDSANALINALDTGSSNLTSNDYVITQYVGGGTTTTTYHRRPASALRVGGLLTGRKLKVALGSTTDVTFNGTVDVTNIPVGGTLGVGYGGTGATSFTSGALLIGNGTGAVGTRTIATSIASNSTSTAIPTSSAVAALVASNKQGTLTFALDTNDTKKLIITYSH